jgi:hypothetical protein
MTGLDHVWKERRREGGTVAPVTENVLRSEIDTPARAHHKLVMLGIAVVAAAAVVALLFLQHSNTGASTSGPSGAPTIVTQAELEHLAASIGHPVYWAGPKQGYSYEVTATKSGRFYVRYLPQGVRAGDPRASFLVVGTYTAAGSFADLKRAAKRDGAISVGTGRGGIVVFSDSRPTSVYFGYPGAKYQVEVYSPSADTARSLVLGSRIIRIPAR